MATRLVSFGESDGRLRMELEPVRWASAADRGRGLRQPQALCVVRSADGRWLAGRRAAWVSQWPNRWALGAGGAVDLGESPAETLSRELREEWSLEPSRLTVEALVGLPNGMAMLVGLATVRRLGARARCRARRVGLVAPDVGSGPRKRTTGCA